MKIKQFVVPASLDQMGDSQNKLQSCKLKLSSGKSVANPSDKPQEAPPFKELNL